MAIAFIKATASGGGIGVTSTTLTLTSTAGNTVLAIVCTNGGGAVTGVTSTPSQTWTLQRSTTSTSPHIEIWSSPLSSAALTQIVVSYAGASDADVIASEYSGVLGFGSVTDLTGFASTLTITLAMQDTNNFIAGGVGVDSNAITTTTGTQRATVDPFGGQVNSANSDNTQVGTGSISITWSMTGSTVNAAAALELRSVSASTLAFDDSAVLFGSITAGFSTTGVW